MALTSKKQFYITEEKIIRINNILNKKLELENDVYNFQEIIEKILLLEKEEDKQEEGYRDNISDFITIIKDNKTIIEGGLST